MAPLFYRSFTLFRLCYHSVVPRFTDLLAWEVVFTVTLRPSLMPYRCQRYNTFTKKQDFFLLAACLLLRTDLYGSYLSIYSFYHSISGKILANLWLIWGFFSFFALLGKAIRGSSYGLDDPEPVEKGSNPFFAEQFTLF